MVYSSRARFERKIKFLDFLKNHRNATTEEIREAGHYESFRDDYRESNYLAGRASITSLPYAVWEERIRVFFEYLRQNPDAGFRSASKAGFSSLLHRVYDGRIDDARKDVGVPKPRRKSRAFSNEVWERRRQELLELMRARPLTTWGYIKNSSYESTYVHFGYTMGRLRREAGVPPLPSRYSSRELRRHRKMAFLSYVNEHPKATPDELREKGHGWALDKLYRGFVLPHVVSAHRAELQRHVDELSELFPQTQLKEMIQGAMIQPIGSWYMPLLEQDESKRLQYVFEQFTQRDMSVLFKYFGLFPRDGAVYIATPKSGNSISENLGISRETVSNVLDNAIDRICRRYYEAAHLYPKTNADEMSLDRIDLPARCLSAIRKLDLKTMAELARVVLEEPEKLTEQRNFSEISYNAIKEKLRLFGLL